MHFQTDTVVKIILLNINMYSVKNPRVKFSYILGEMVWFTKGMVTHMSMENNIRTKNKACYQC